jgi:type II secretory pathway component HofQ
VVKTVLLTFLLAVPALAAEKPRTVTLDVKDEDVVLILRSMQQQCGIKNMVIDKDVQGKGTFLFHELPCPRAFEVVFETMSLRAKSDGGDVMNVIPRSK